MPYMVERDGMAFGPYSLEDLQQKVIDNEFALTDRACDDKGGIWLPLSKLFAGHTGDLAVITSGRVDASTIFASLKRKFFRSQPAQ
jgi:hypothetical protein